MSDQSDGFLNTPILSEKNSHNNSLGASISDLSLEGLSENSEYFLKNKAKQKDHFDALVSGTFQKPSRFNPKKN